MDKRYLICLRAVGHCPEGLSRRLLHAVMNLNCVPVTMELARPSAEEDWQYVRSVIADCDYYLLVIFRGEGTGATAEEADAIGREYQYAAERGIGIVALVQQTGRRPGPRATCDSNVRLEALTKTASAGRDVMRWARDDELPGLATLCLSRAMRVRPPVGWVRATVVANERLLADFYEARRENEQLKQALDRQRARAEVSAEGLAGLDEEFAVRMRSKLRTHPHWRDWTSRLKWKDIFGVIGSHLFNRPDDQRVKELLGLALAKLAGERSFRHEVDDDDFQTIKVQLRALGLVEFAYGQGPRGSTRLIWSLSPAGEQHVLRLRAVGGSGGDSPLPETAPTGAAQAMLSEAVPHRIKAIQPA